MAETYFDKYGWKILNDLFGSTLYFFYNEEAQRNSLWRFLFPHLCKVRLPNGKLMGTYRYKDIPKVGIGPETERLIKRTKRISAFSSP